MLAAALEAEVNAYIAELADQRDKNRRRLVVHNGYHQPRKVTTAAGTGMVKALRVNDRRSGGPTTPPSWIAICRPRTTCTCGPTTFTGAYVWRRSRPPRWW